MESTDSLEQALEVLYKVFGYLGMILFFGSTIAVLVLELATGCFTFQ